MKLIFIAQTEFLNILDVSSNLQAIDPVNLELVCVLIFTGASRQELNFSLREFYSDVDVVNWNDILKCYQHWLKRATNSPPSTVECEKCLDGIVKILG